MMVRPTLQNSSSCVGDTHSNPLIVNGRTNGKFSTPDDSKPNKQAIGSGDMFLMYVVKEEESDRFNDLRCNILSSSKSPTQFKVYIEGKDEDSHSDADKYCNLVPLLPLQYYCKKQEDCQKGPSRAREICDLLLCHRSPLLTVEGNGNMNEEDFHTFHIVCQSYVQGLSSHQVIQMTGILALAKLCAEDGEKGAGKVLSALLEGGQCYVDTLLETIYSTGLMLRRNSMHDAKNYLYEAEITVHKIDFVNPTTLTPDQTSLGYVRFMMAGPLCLLTRILQYEFGEALLSVIVRSEFYHLLVQRLLRLVAREALFTFDGSELGSMARVILQKLFPSITLKQRIDRETAESILESTSGLKNRESVLCEDAINELLAGPM